MSNETGRPDRSWRGAHSLSLEEIRERRMRLQDDVDNTLSSLSLLGSSGVVRMDDLGVTFRQLLHDVRQVRRWLAIEAAAELPSTPIPVPAESP